MSQDITKAGEYRDLIASLKSRIQAAQIKAALAVNSQLIALYWDIGQQIAKRQQTSGWGDAVIEQIAHDLSREFQTMKGFSRRNLYRMKQFYAFYGRCCINRDRPHIQGYEQAKAEVSDTELAGVQRGVGGTWIVDGVV